MRPDYTSAPRPRIGPRRLRRLLGLPPWRRPGLGDLLRGAQSRFSPVRSASLDALQIIAGSDRDLHGDVARVVDDLVELEAHP
jgi:hypothetical protein